MFFFENHEVVAPEGFDFSKWGNHLQTVWRDRYSFGLENEGFRKFNPNSKQRLLNFSTSNKDGGSLRHIKAGNYIGTIQLDDEQINILPKVFYSEGNKTELNNNEKLFSRYVNSHVLWWMSYTDKIRLPKTFASYETEDSDLFEILIYLFAYYTENLVCDFSFNDYEQEEDDLSLVRGRIKMNDYISNIGRGEWHKIPCEFSDFQHDNLLNQIILFVTKILSDKSKNPKSKQLLEEIIGHLNGVSDVHVTSVDCERVSLNPMYEEYSIVLDYCRMFLDSIVTGRADDSVSVFAFLVDMNSLYEDFLGGFMNDHKGELNLKHKVEKGTRDNLGIHSLTSAKAFNVKLDYLLSFNRDEDSVRIADAKYKQIYSKEIEGNSKTKGFGINSSDIYQMIAYSYRKGINKINLIYPLFAAENQDGICHKFDIYDEHNDVVIEVTAATLNIIERDVQLFNNSSSMESVFQSAAEKLIQDLIGIFE